MAGGCHTGSVTRDESDVPEMERILSVESRLSAEAVDLVRDGLPEVWPGNCEAFFMPFAYADLPIGKVFDCCFLLSDPQTCEVVRVEIVAVTQQWATPLTRFRMAGRQLPCAHSLRRCPS
jgi:hypothetical protein